MPIFSYIFHPLFIGVYGALIYFIFTPYWYDYQEIYVVFLQIIILTILIPVTLFYLLLSLGKISSFVSPSLNDRKIPLMLSILLNALLLFKSINVVHLPELFYFFSSIILVSFLALLGLFYKIKISIHAAGISLLTFFAIGLSITTKIDMLVLISVLILLNGFVGSSRLFMKAHTMRELTYGFLLGSISQISLWYFWL
jgi:hypothetical protein